MTDKTKTPKLAAEGAPEDGKAPEETPFDAKTAYSAMTEEINSMKAALAAITEQLKPKQEEEPAGESMQMSATLKRIAELEDANARLELKAVGITEGQDDLVKLARLDRALFSAQVQRLVKLSAEPTRQNPTSPGTTGVVGGSKAPLTEIVKLAAASVKSGEVDTFTAWAIKNGHEDRVDEFLDSGLEL